MAVLIVQREIDLSVNSILLVTILVGLSSCLQSNHNKIHALDLFIFDAQIRVQVFQHTCTCQ